MHIITSNTPFIHAYLEMERVTLLFMCGINHHLNMQEISTQHISCGSATHGISMPLNRYMLHVCVCVLQHRECTRTAPRRGWITINTKGKKTFSIQIIISAVGCQLVCVSYNIENVKEQHQGEVARQSIFRLEYIPN
jgi:hypothetical protein